MPLTASTYPGDLAHDEPQPYLWTMNFGPQHPATHTTLRLVLKLDGETVVDAMPDIGYLHSGFEKLGEHLDYNQYVTITDRMNYVSPMSNNVAWHLAVEKLLGIETPPRCQYIRVIISELSRITDHLLCLGAMGLDTGAFTHFIYAFNPREEIYDIFEALCGARFTNSYTRVGGLMYDASPKAIQMIRDFLKQIPQTFDDMERLLNRNRIFIDRTRGVGVLSKAEAINRSCSGPVARASGVTRDLRKDEPYLAYRRLRFQRLLRRGRRLLRPLPGPHGRDEGERQDHPAGGGEPARRPGERGRRRPGDSAPQGRGLLDDRRADHALRAGDDQPGLSGAVRRSILCHRGAQRRVGVLPGRRRHAAGVSRPLPPAVVHPLCRLPAPDPRPHPERRGGGAGQPERHRGGVGPVRSMRRWHMLKTYCVAGYKSIETYGVRVGPH